MNLIYLACHLQQASTLHLRQRKQGLLEAGWRLPLKPLWPKLKELGQWRELFYFMLFYDFLILSVCIRVLFCIKPLSKP